jgi:Flp pilus assembly protein TadD
MHYLLSQNKLSETGTYLGLVEVQKLPVTQAIQQAYGVSAEQFLGAIKEYFQSVAPALRVQTGSLTTTASSGPIQVDPSPLAPLDVGTSVHQLPPAEADALVAEMELRITERRAQAVDELRRLAGGTETETAVAHRALAWALLQEKKYAEAYQELQTASGLDKQDFWVHYYLALVPFEQSRTSASALEHLPNVMQDLHAVLDQHPDVAEAYNMLAMAQLEGGGVHAAASSIHYAMQLAPRNQGYVYNLAKIELAGKDWENATTLLTRLKGSSNSQIAAAAQQDLADLPTLRKYGVLPQRAGAKPAAAPAVVYNSGGDDEETSGEDQRPAQTGPDMRKSQYLQGKLLSVDCSQAPVAILRVTGKTKTLKLRTDDYKSLLLVGTDQFSCDWKDVPVVVNYKAGGKSDGDLVSLELR